MTDDIPDWKKRFVANFRWDAPKRSSPTAEMPKASAPVGRVASSDKTAGSKIPACVPTPKDKTAGSKIPAWVPTPKDESRVASSEKVAGNKILAWVAAPKDASSHTNYGSPLKQQKTSPTKRHGQELAATSSQVGESPKTAIGLPVEAAETRGVVEENKRLLPGRFGAGALQQSVEERKRPLSSKGESPPVEERKRPVPVRKVPDDAKNTVEERKRPQLGRKESASDTQSVGSSTPRPLSKPPVADTQSVGSSTPRPLSKPPVAIGASDTQSAGSATPRPPSKPPPGYTQVQSQTELQPTAVKSAAAIPPWQRSDAVGAPKEVAKQVKRPLPQPQPTLNGASKGPSAASVTPIGGLPKPVPRVDRSSSTISDSVPKEQQLRQFPKFSDSVPKEPQLRQFPKFSRERKESFVKSTPPERTFAAVNKVEAKVENDQAPSHESQETILQEVEERLWNSQLTDLDKKNILNFKSFLKLDDTTELALKLLCPLKLGEILATDVQRVNKGADAIKFIHGLISHADLHVVRLVKEIERIDKSASGDDTSIKEPPLAIGQPPTSRVARRGSSGISAPHAKANRKVLRLPAGNIVSKDPPTDSSPQQVARPVGLGQPVTHSTSRTARTRSASIPFRRVRSAVANQGTDAKRSGRSRSREKLASHTVPKSYGVNSHTVPKSVPFANSLPAQKNHAVTKPRAEARHAGNDTVRAIAEANKSARHAGNDTVRAIAEANKSASSGVNRGRSSSGRSRSRSRSRRDSQSVKQAPTDAEFLQIITEKIRNSDQNGTLEQYIPALCREFQSIVQLQAVINEENPAKGVLNCIEPALWEVLQVRTLGHKLLLAKAIMSTVS